MGSAPGDEKEDEPVVLLTGSQKLASYSQWYWWGYSQRSVVRLVTADITEKQLAEDLNDSNTRKQHSQ